MEAYRSMSFLSGKAGKVLGTMPIWMSRAIWSSPSILSRFAVAVVSSSMYFLSDTCIYLNALLRTPISSVRSICGSSTSSFPEAMVSACVASELRGFICRWMMKYITRNIRMSPRMRLRRRVFLKRLNPPKMSDSGHTIPMLQPVVRMGLKITKLGAPLTVTL